MSCIFVVEDEYDIQELLKNYLEEDGYEVCCASDGAEAIQLFGQAESKIDLVLLRKNGGSGLGLYIVREILEQHGAWYEMKNTKKGVLFQFKMGNDACNLK